MTTTVDQRDVTAGPAEAPLRLDEPAPRVLGWLDQIGLWGNLGISLLGPVGAIGVLKPAGFPALSLAGAALAVVVGTVIGTAMVAAAAVPGAQTGAPSMVLLRGLFGRRLSYLPTAVNIVQLIGWSVFEIVVITQAAQQLVHVHGYRWAFILGAGVLTTLMTIKPLGAVRVLRRYALVLVSLATAYLFVQLLRHPLPALTHGAWSGFWPACDVAIAVAVSWAPLASDYSRHARSSRSAFGSAMLGYTVTQTACYVLGLIALATVVRSSNADVLQHDMFAAFIAVPVGWLAFGVLVARELDQSFADGYSTVVSLQNIWPRVDRRLLSVVVCGIATALALALTISDYFNFLYLLGSVFVPLTAVFLVDYFLGRRRWDVTETAPARFATVVPWLLGFATYQLVYPGGIGWWVHGWTWVADRVHFTYHSWMSASVLSFVVAAVATLPITVATRRSRQ